MVKKKNKHNAKKSSNSSESDFIYVDPTRVRFQHSRIRPYFSGCGRSVVETFESIRRHEMTPDDLPPIQVLVGPVGGDGQPWYFSLNNRRLWVLKRCREEGLLTNNQIRVRVRTAKSSGEELRYTIDNCALEAKLMRESSVTATPKTSTEKESNVNEEVRTLSKGDNGGKFKREQHEILLDNPPDDDSSSDDSFHERSNPFSVLL